MSGSDRSVRTNGARVRPGLPRLAACAAVAAIAAALVYCVQRDTPVGSIRGEVFLTDSRKRMDGIEVVLSQDTGDETQVVRRTRTGKDGVFRMGLVPTGEYTLSASATYHATHDVHLAVDEGRTTPIALSLDRTEPDLQVIRHQSVFGTHELAHISVSGYVDSDQPLHRDAISVRVYRTRISSTLGTRDGAEALEEVGRGYDPAPRLPAALLDPDGAERPRLNLARSYTITQDDREGFYYEKLGFGSLPPGLYLIDVKHGVRTGCSWLLVTDTALVTKRASGQAVAYVVDMKRGTPRPGSAVRAYRNGKIVAQSTTDSHGLAELRIPGDPKNSDDAAATTVVARNGEDEAVVTGSHYSSEDEGDYVVHAYTDRPIYRPGQQIRFKGIVRRKLDEAPPPATEGLDSPAGSPGPRYAVPSGTPVAIEMRSPQGERVLKMEAHTNDYGSFSGSASLSPEAATGVYTLAMKIDGDEHTHDIVVASYRKPEFAVTVTPDKKRYVRGDAVTMTISALYYFGAPVAGAKVSYTVYSSQDWSGEYEEDGIDSADDVEGDSDPYFYHNRGEAYDGEVERDGKAVLDQDGKATIRFATNRASVGLDTLAEIYTASVTVSEGDNREVEEDGTARVEAGDFQLFVRPDGYVASPGVPFGVSLHARDDEGHPIANQPVDIDGYYDVWRSGKDQRVPLGTRRVTTGPDGRARLSVVPTQTGSLRLNAHTVDSGGRTITAQGYLWVVDEHGDDLATEYADLSILPDRRRYAPGDTARVLINASHTGETALITIEGARVYRSEIVPLVRHSTVIRVPISAEYGPNIALDACYISDKHFAQSEAMLRVPLPARRLALSVTSDRTAAAGLPRYHPGDPIRYTVKATDSQGRPARCEFSLGVVDEAIYALREDDPKALQEAFYPARTNSVRTDFSFAVEYLGDADKAEPKIVSRKKFPDTAFWAPAMRTGADGTASVSLRLPDNLTTWRTTVTADTLDTKLGRAVCKVIAAKEFMVRIEAPRFLTSTDTSRIAAIVSNETGAAQTALVRLRGGSLTLEAPATRRLTVAPGANIEVDWPVVAGQYGDAHLEVTAWTLPPQGGRQDTDGMESVLPVRPHAREVVTTGAGALTGSQPGACTLALAPDAVPDLTRLTVRITPSIATALTGATDYLIGFPYGCTEQTMSRFMPDLLVQRALRLRGLTAIKNAADLPRMVRDSLERLYRFQHDPSGAWGWWQFDNDDPHMTAYVLYGLTVARKAGYPVNAAVLASGRKAAARMVAANSLDPDDRAFLGCALALAGDKHSARLALSHLSIPYLLPEAAAYAGLLEMQLGRSPAPELRRLATWMRTDGPTAWWPVGCDPDWDDVTPTAAALRLLIAHDPDDPRITPVLRWLMLKRTDDYWMSTQATSEVLQALCDYLTAKPASAAAGAVRVLVNGTSAAEVPLTADVQQEREIVLRVPASALHAGSNEVRVEHVSGGASVFYTAELRQYVPDMPATARSSDLRIVREYLRLAPRHVGDEGWRLSTEQTNNHLTAGETVRVRLSIVAKRNLDYVLIEDPYPAGCDLNDRGDPDDAESWQNWWAASDPRDDHIAFFARHIERGKSVLEYNLRASAPGVYAALPALAQAMYAPQVKAETAATTVQITDRPAPRRE